VLQAPASHWIEVRPPVWPLQTTTPFGRHIKFLRDLYCCCKALLCLHVTVRPEMGLAPTANGRSRWAAKFIANPSAHAAFGCYFFRFGIEIAHIHRAMRGQTGDSISQLKSPQEAAGTFLRGRMTGTLHCVGGGVGPSYRAPAKMALRRQTAKHPFGTIKCWMA
jgi:hypothetical protein